MAFIKTIPPEEATGTLKQLYEAAYQRLGFYPTPIAALSMRPEVQKAWQNLNQTIQSAMTSRHYELATVSAAVALQCSA